MAINNYSYGRVFFDRNECLYVETTCAKQSQIKNRWLLMTTLMEDKLICGSECLYMEETIHVKQSEMKKMWVLTVTLWEDNYFCESECLYVERSTYVRQSDMNK